MRSLLTKRCRPANPLRVEQMKSMLDRTIRADTGAWFETHGRIWPKDRSGGMITPRRNCLQERIGAVESKMEADGLPVREVVLKPRSRGSSTYFSASGYTRARRKSVAGVIIGGEYTQTDELWKHWQAYQANDGFNGWGNTGEINERVGKWSNGSTLKKETARDEHAGIAGVYQFLHVTELGRWKNEGKASAGNVLANILKCVPNLPGTMVVLESTAEGDTGEFPEKWRQAIPADDYLSGRVTPKPGDYIAIFAAWFEFDDSAVRLTEEQKREVEATLDANPVFGVGGEERKLISLYGVTGGDGVVRLGAEVAGFDVWEQLAWRRQAILNDCKRDWRIFDRDYPHSPAAAFQASGKGVFVASQLDAVEKAGAKHSATHGCVDRVGGVGSPHLNQPTRVSFRATPEFEAWATVFEKPTPGRRYLVIVDPATGSERATGEDPDRHSAIVLRAGQFIEDRDGWLPPCVVARVKPPCGEPIDVLADWVDRLSWLYGRCTAAFEINNSGLALYEASKPWGTPLYERDITPYRREGPAVKRVGWETTEPTRKFLVETLQRAVRELGTDGEGVIIPCPHMMAEMRKFVIVKGKAQAGRGAHDDDVLALGIGLCLQSSATVFNPAIERRILPAHIQRIYDRKNGFADEEREISGQAGASQYT